MMSSSSKILKSLLIISLSLLFLVGCGLSEASEVLGDRVFNKHSGDGAEGLAFLDGGLIVNEGGTLPPELEMQDLQEQEESETIHYDSVDLFDDNGEFVVKYEGEELYRFRINDDGLLEEENGTTYLTNNMTDESEVNESDE